MFRVLAITLIAARLAASEAAVAAQRTVTLAVDAMTCASCPYIVRSVLLDVPGVERADVSFAEGTAVVTFDDAKTDVSALRQATRSVGFPSRVIEE